MKTTKINLISRCKNIVFIETRAAAAGVAIVREMLDESLGLVEYQELPDFDGISVVKSEQSMGLAEALVAAMTRDLFGRPVIYVDNFFAALSPLAQEFVLWHEVGHIRDTDMMLKPFFVRQWERRLQLLKGEVTREEAFADDYAIARVGTEKAVFAMNELLAFSSAYRLSGTDGEMQLRLDRIQAQRKI